MKLFHSYLAARERKSGKIVILASAWSLAVAGGVPITGSIAEVSAAHERLRDDPEAHAKFSHVVFVLEFAVRAQYEFPDLAAERAEKEKRDKANAEATTAREVEHVLAKRSALLAELADNDRRMTALGVELPGESSAALGAGVVANIPSPANPPADDDTEAARLAAAAAGDSTAAKTAPPAGK